MRPALTPIKVRVALPRHILNGELERPERAFSRHLVGADLTTLAATGLHSREKGAHQE
jgi:hypothetical protein